MNIIAEKPNVNTFNSVLAGLIGGNRYLYYLSKLNLILDLPIGLAGLAVGHPFGRL
jgi:hypothetical protein